MDEKWIAYACHELRTPLTVMKGYAELLKDEAPTSALVEKILSSCHRMEKTIRRLLALSDQLHLQLCDMKVLVQECIAHFPSAEITIEGEKTFAQVDRDLFELVILNLLENGVKYSPSPARLTITLSQDVIHVQDAGIGIPAEKLPHLFEPFYSANKADSRRLGGSGLGLSLVKAIVEKHGGTVSVSSTVGQGTTFSILLGLRE
jgi:two-component system, OmpR family, phosphate regulon sensor histidine kinase PhoR